MKNPNQWSEELFSLDGKPNLKANLDQMFYAYLETPNADDCRQRQEISILYRHLRQLFVTKKPN